MNSLLNLEIPVGTTSTGEIFKLKLFPMNCYITGSPGSGKTNLLRIIVKNTLKKYSSENIRIWLFSSNWSEFNDFLMLYPDKLTNMDICSNDLINSSIKILFDETINRIKFFSENRVSSYAELKDTTTMPRLIIIFDDFGIVDNALQKDNDLKYMFEKILVIGREVGISLIMTNQIPQNECYSLSGSSRAFIHVLGSFKNLDGFIFDALDILKQDISEEDKKRIYDYLIKPGTFVLNEYEIDENKEQFVNKITLVLADYIPYQK